MSFDIPTPFDDWEEPAYIFIDAEGVRLFLVQDANAFIWVDVVDPGVEEMIVDLIDNSIWTPYAVMALCEAEGILYGIIYMRFKIDHI